MIVNFEIDCVFSTTIHCDVPFEKEKQSLSIKNVDDANEIYQEKDDSAEN